jgi:hypothetical protein
VLALAVVVLAVVGVVAMLPPRAVSLPADGAIDEPVRGVVHVHSRLSDGTGTPEQIAAAAARAGLKFVIFTDHGDGMREPEPPIYRDGVLCIDAVEISTSDGHLVALGLWGKAPYPLGGEARDVVEDVARLGGMSIAAHPESAKPDLAWKAWDVPVDGLEWLNADSEWRDEPFPSLARAMFTYPIRDRETLASLLDRPASMLERWDGFTRTRRVVGLAAMDAHANLGFGTESVDVGARSRFAFPAYDASFRTFSIALPAVRLSGDPAADARAVVQEIREGHVYSSIDALAGPGRLTVKATSGARTAGPGDELPAGGPVALRAETNAPPGARLVILADGREVAGTDEPAMTYEAPVGRAAYRVEVYLPGVSRDGSALPWLASNPVYVGGYADGSKAPTTVALQKLDTLTQFHAGTFGPDHKSFKEMVDAGLIGVEKNDESMGDVSVHSGRLLFRYGLGGSPSEAPWVALGLRSGPKLPQYDRVTFTARADVPTRLWVALWMPVPTGNRYWRRSVYIDSTERELSVRFSDLRPVADAPATPPLAEIQSVMYIVDQTNTSLGGSGRVWIDNIRYGRTASRPDGQK